jgi:hypothetical protein
MAIQECPICSSGNGLNMMKGEVTQLQDVTTNTPKIIEWTCGFCGYTDSDTIYLGSLGGAQNEKSIVHPVSMQVEEPIEATRPEEPLQAAKKPPKAPKPVEEAPAADIID